MLEKGYEISISVVSMSCIFYTLYWFVNSKCLLVSRGGGGSNSPVIMFTDDQKDIQWVKKLQEWLNLKNILRYQLKE